MVKAAVLRAVNEPLVIEDIHWADTATLQCLHYLARHFVRIPIALFFSLRRENLSTDPNSATMTFRTHCNHISLTAAVRPLNFLSTP